MKGEENIANIKIALLMQSYKTRYAIFFHIFTVTFIPYGIHQRNYFVIKIMIVYGIWSFGVSDWLVAHKKREW